MFEKILVCLDGSKLAEQILPYATEEAIRFNSRVELFHVVPEPVIDTQGIPGATGVPIEPTGALEQMRSEQKVATDYLERVASDLRKKGIVVELVIQQGAAGEAIIGYSQDNDVGLIAIATHGRGGLGRAFFGSVADHVLRNSGLPVLVVRPQ